MKALTIIKSNIIQMILSATKRKDPNMVQLLGYSLDMINSKLKQLQTQG